MKKRKIAVVMKSFFSRRVSALARVVMETSLRLVENSHEVEIVTDGAVNKTLTVGGIKVVQLRTRFWHNPFFPMLSYVKNGSFDEIQLHVSLLGLITCIPLLSCPGPRRVAFLYTGRASVADFRSISGLHLLRYWRRIFLRNYFFTLFIPSWLIHKALSHIDILIVPSLRLKKYYLRFVRKPKKIFAVYPGVNNIFEKIGKPQPDTNYLRLKKQVRGRRVVLHAGLASPFRGMYDSISVFREIYNLDSKYLMLYLVYADSGENIDHSTITRLSSLLKKSLPGGSYIVIDKPINDIRPFYRLASCAFYNYRYVGDIPECPLTLIEILRENVPVFVNDSYALKEYVPKPLLYTTHDYQAIAKKIHKVMTKNKLMKTIETSQFDWDRFIRLLDL